MERVKFDMEFIFRASPTIIYQFFTTPACLTRWYCDEVDISEDEYTFVWDGAPETALLIDDIEEERLRFKWEDADDEDEFFEIRINKSPVTNETIIEISDFADEDEVDDQKQLWSKQMEQLRKETGG